MQSFENLNSIPGQSHHNPKIQLKSSVVMSTFSNRSVLLREDLKDLKSFSPTKSPLNTRLLGNNYEGDIDFDKKFINFIN
jgi:hypothetical protein